MRTRMYGGVRGRKTRVGEKLHRFPPTRFLYLAHKHRETTERRAGLLLHDFLHKSLHNTKKSCTFAAQRSLDQLLICI